MTEPSHLLSQKRARISELQAALAVEEAELRGMEMMASIFPTPSRNVLEQLRVGPKRVESPKSAEPASKGRQPGSISMRWRAVLWRLDSMGGNFSPADIVAVVKDLEGRPMRPTDAKRQMDVYADLGFISAENDVYNVTDQFRSKFADSAQDGSNENAPPSSIVFDDELGGAETGLEGL